MDHTCYEPPFETGSYPICYELLLWLAHIEYEPITEVAYNKYDFANNWIILSMSQIQKVDHTCYEPPFKTGSYSICYDRWYLALYTQDTHDFIIDDIYLFMINSGSSYWIWANYRFGLYLLWATFWN